jgi:hypothetical protein
MKTSKLFGIPPNLLSIGYQELFPGSEADYSHASSAEVKDVQSFTSTPQYPFVSWCSVKAQGQLYFTFIFAFAFTIIPLRVQNKGIIMRRIKTLILIVHKVKWESYFHG